MDNKDKHLEALTSIRELMERSTRLASFSGISGITAGIFAIIGAVSVSFYTNTGFFEQNKSLMQSPNNPDTVTVYYLIASALIVFFLAAAAALYITSRKAKTQNITFWDNMTKRVLLNLSIFLFTGGVFCVILMHYGIYFLIVPTMLFFYGLALINVSKFTMNEIAQLGIIEILLGVFASFVPVYPLLMWVIGFGVLHVVYGSYVYFKYERKKA